MPTPLSVLWPATTIIIGGPSFTISFTRDSMSPVRWMSMKCDDAPQSEVMVNFGGSAVAESTRNEKPMPNEGNSMMLYVVGAS